MKELLQRALDDAYNLFMKQIPETKNKDSPVQHSKPYMIH
jgi:hypothetical protein